MTNLSKTKEILRDD